MRVIFDCLYFRFYFVLIHLFSFVFPISRFFSPSASLYFNTNKRFIHSFIRSFVSVPIRRLELGLTDCVL